MTKPAQDLRPDLRRPPPPPPAPNVFPRRPTPPEWAEISGTFPALNQADVWITDDPTWVYNCIAWSLGYTDRWINPPQPRAAFDYLYVHDHGYRIVPALAPDAEIDGWELDGAMT